MFSTKYSRSTIHSYLTVYVMYILTQQLAVHVELIRQLGQERGSLMERVSRRGIQCTGSAQSVASYLDQVASTDCKICPKYYQTRGPGSTSREDCYGTPEYHRVSHISTYGRLNITCYFCMHGGH